MKFIKHLLILCLLLCSFESRHRRSKTHILPTTPPDNLEELEKINKLTSAKIQFQKNQKELHELNDSATTDLTKKLSDEGKALMEMKTNSPVKFCWKGSHPRNHVLPTFCPDDKIQEASLCWPKDICHKDEKLEGHQCVKINANYLRRYVYSPDITTPVTTQPKCPEGMSWEAGICYPPCIENYKGIGIVCWGKCNEEFPNECGAACIHKDKTCAEKVAQDFNNLFNAIGAGLSMQVGKAVASSANFINAAFNAPYCQPPVSPETLKSKYGISRRRRMKLRRLRK